MSTLKVDGIRSNSASSDAITLASDGTCTANITNNLSNRNLIINGAMNVAQRGTSATTDGYKFLDRWQTSAGNLSTGQNVVRSQQSLSSSDTGPFEAGFRKYARIATGAAGTLAANSYLDFYQHIEAQNIANSGWNYTSASSYITVSFWLRCSTNQTFYLFLRSRDGTNQAYATPITASANNTWTKITKTIPGNSNIAINDDNGSGLTVAFMIAYGSDYTDNGRATNTWAAHSSSTHSPDVASTWLTAGASTFDVTGLQLEVGSVATDFEHRSYAQELALCKRYYQQFPQSAADNYGPIGVGRIRNSTNAHIVLTFPEMRSSPTCTKSGNLRILHAATGTVVNSVASSHMARSTVFIEGIVSSGLAQGEGCILTADNDADGRITLSAEL